MSSDKDATVARDAADRSQAAADLADRRARDADRLTRWMVGVAIALAAALAVQMMALQGAVADLRAVVIERLDRQQNILDRLTE